MQSGIEGKAFLQQGLFVADSLGKFAEFFYVGIVIERFAVPGYLTKMRQQNEGDHLLGFVFAETMGTQSLKFLVDLRIERVIELFFYCLKKHLAQDFFGLFGFNHAEKLSAMITETRL